MLSKIFGLQMGCEKVPSLATSRTDHLMLHQREIVKASKPSKVVFSVCIDSKTIIVITKTNDLLENSSVRYAKWSRQSIGVSP